MKKLLFAWLVLVLGGTAPAQDRDPLKIESVMVGFPASGRLKNAVGNDSFNKGGCWTPVYITIRCAKPFPAPGYIIVSSADCDEVPTRYRVALPPMQPGQTEKILAYTRPGGRRDSIRVAVYGSNDREICPDAMAVNKGIEVSQFLYLGIGSQLDSALLPGLPTTEGESTVARSLDARSLLASVARIEDLPQQWFAYNSVDTVLISTADRDFATALVSERDGRKAALTEWVRRGGNLVVSVGRNQDLFAGAGELNDSLPVRLTGTADVEIPRIAWTDGIASDEPLGKVTCANVEMRTDRNPSALLSTKDRPLVVRAAYGLGRVTVVAFDVDGKPLDRWKGRETFWRELTNRSGTRVPTAASDQPGAFGRYGDTVAEDGDFATLIRSMENFPGVPVISFGWVALFILGYILLVGPIDYLFLKKVVKRLEFTWITFPIIVFTVSGIAYYAAYALKGGDLRINKYDLVEIDVRNRLVQGRTWFTLFSPRIQNYRIGVESAWANGADGPDTTVGWAGQSRNSRQSLFPRSYDYLPKAAGLDSVPVQ
ncbi:MAG: hypothetical protein K1X57_16780, partial [Gemmataceae bacterium]|nr:hypothetical protein [Gemmataceae bacterium]